MILTILIENIQVVNIKKTLNTEENMGKMPESMGCDVIKHKWE